MTYKDIAKIIPTIQAAQLAGHNLKATKKKNMKSGDFLKLGMENVVGTSMIKINADLIGDL